MAKKKKLPLSVRMIPIVFPIYETIFPKLARKAAVKLFLTPLKFKRHEKEALILLEAEPHHFKHKGELLNAYAWGNPSNKTVLLMHGWAGRCSQFHIIIRKLVADGFYVIGFNAPAHGESKKKMTNVVEFAEAIKDFMEDKNIHGAIGHSLGGLALLYGLEKKWFSFNRLITIASPTIAKDVVDVFRKKINVSEKVYDNLDRFTMKKMGKPFAYFSGVEIAKRIEPKFKDHLIIHDQNDQEAPVEHAYALHDAMGGYSEIFKTQTLGHVKVLFDKKVSEKISRYLQV